MTEKEKLRTNTVERLNTRIDMIRESPELSLIGLLFLKSEEKNSKRIKGILRIYSSN